MEAFIESGMLDSATVDVEKTAKKSSKAESGGEIENVRTYDLNITYDKFYQVHKQILISTMKAVCRITLGPSIFYHNNQMIALTDEFFSTLFCK